MKNLASCRCLPLPLARVNVATELTGRASLAIVAPRGKKRATSADDWLIEGAETARHEGDASDEDFAVVAPPPKAEPPAGNAGRGTKQWLAVPEPAKGEPPPEVQRAQPGRSRELADALEERDALRKRVEELESELADAKKRVTPKETGSRAEWVPEVKAEGESEARARPAATGKRAKGGKVDLNSATFEELRDLGLSVTLSARLIAYRDVRGGFESLDELNGIPGFAKDTLRQIREQLTLEA